MEEGAHLWRFPTGAAIDAIVARFALEPHAHMQDPEIELADPARLPDFLAAYEHAGLDDDERFLLMAIIVHSFDRDGRPLAGDAAWGQALHWVEADLPLHRWTVWSWATLSTPDADDFDVVREMRKVVAAHPGIFARRP